jgi:uncharacterized membrane protein YozB (DUF420 family)
MTELDVHTRSADAHGHPRRWVAVTAALIVVVLVFAARRVMVDVPHVTAGTVPDEGIDREYALHPLLAATHIGLGVVYLLGASLQLWRPFRVRHYQVHRRLGRVLAPLAAVSGATGVIFGARYAFGGRAESAASVLFGSWFVLALVLAVVAIRRGDVVSHRRWMVRAFAVGLAVGTVRVWIGVFSALGVLTFPDRFAVSFWIGFCLHVLVAEWWLRTRPYPGPT